MIKSKKELISDDSRSTPSSPYHSLWRRSRGYLLSKLSWGYLPMARRAEKETNDEIIVGYESSWPDSYTKLH